MGLFGNKKEGGLMDVIRCDEEDFVIWKWSPDGQPSRKENAIRYGSSLRVSRGQVAVFVYKQKSGQMEDYIVGPYDETIKTANFPVLTSIVGAAFGGASPFQAEIYFVNTGQISKNFFLRNLPLFDYRYPDAGIPADVKGSIKFNISEVKEFAEKYHFQSKQIDDFWDEIEMEVTGNIRDAIGNVSVKSNIPLVQIQNTMTFINRQVTDFITEEFKRLYRINVEKIIISEITLDKENDDYKNIFTSTTNQVREFRETQTTVGKQQMLDNQAIQSENYTETLRINREEQQRLQRLQTEGANIVAHQIDAQRDVAMTAAESLGTMGAGMSFGDGGGMNPAGMMTGMMMGGAVGGSMANMMGNMMQGLNQPQPPAPPAGAIAQWHISTNGQQAGPYTIAQLQQMVGSGAISRTTYVWKAGMAAWEQAGNIQEVAAIFGAVPPPPPPSAPQTPPPPPAF